MGIKTAQKSVLDEKVTVTLTWFELQKIRDWNLKRMESAAQALENPIMKPAKRSRWQVEYDFHTELCDHLHGVELEEEDKIREHNENVRAGIDVVDRIIAEMTLKKTLLGKTNDMNATAAVVYMKNGTHSKETIKKAIDSYSIHNTKKLDVYVVTKDGRIHKWRTHQ